MSGQPSIEVLDSKTPAEMLPIEFRWARELGANSVVASAWSSAPAGLTFTGETFAGDTTGAVASAGETGGRYTITNRITDNAGAVHEKSALLPVTQHR